MTLQYRGTVYNKPESTLVRVDSETILTWRGKKYHHTDIKEKANA